MPVAEQKTIVNVSDPGLKRMRIEMNKYLAFLIGYVYCELKCLCSLMPSHKMIEVKNDPDSVGL